MKLNQIFLDIECQKKIIKKVDKTYEKVFTELSIELNRVHKINWNKRSWRLVIGPWLIYFISIVENYITSKKKKIKKKLFQGINHLCCRDLAEFKHNFNLKKWHKYVENRVQNNEKFFLKKNRKIKFSQLKNKYKNINKLNLFLLKILERVLCFKNSFCFYKPYFGKSYHIFKIFLYLKEIPFFYQIQDKYRVLENYNNDFRKKIRINLKPKNNLEKVLENLLIEAIPTVYLEGFKNMIVAARDSLLPKKIKNIFTANIYKDNIFKFWAADQLNKGAKLLIYQHGGNYGIDKNLWGLKHELNVCDNFFSKGWKMEKNKKIFPAVNFFSMRSKKIEKETKKILLVAPVLDIFRTDNNLKYQNNFEQINMIKIFLSNIEEKIFNKIYLKPHPKEYLHSYSLSEEILKKFPKIKILKKKDPVENIYNDYCLIIFFYNSTSFGNIINFNLPSILITPEIYFKKMMESQSQKTFKNLQDSKLYFTDSFKASLHINSQFKDLNKWWNLKKTLDGRKNFEENYSNISSRMFQKFMKDLKNNLDRN